VSTNFTIPAGLEPSTFRLGLRRYSGLLIEIQEKKCVFDAYRQLFSYIYNLSLKSTKNTLTA